MVDALVSFVLDQLATVIQDEIQQEVRLVVGVRDEVKKLTTTFKAIQAVLTDAEKRQITDELVKVWYEEFKEVAYDMDDILDEWSYEILRSQIEGAGTEKVINYSYFHSFFSCFSNVSLRHDIGVKIKKIRERLEFIEKEKNKYRLIEIKSEEKEKKPLDDRPKTSSLIDVSEVCGRDLDKEIIISKLLGESSRRGKQKTGLPLHLPNIDIISVVGMGGLGKTTLSQLVFNDDQVQNYFEQIMWVCVSDPFDLIKITKAIIGETKNDVPSYSEWNALHHCLVDCLKEKKFLLVLDDVWSEDETKWEPLRLSLKYGAPGSRVLVTTRNERVAMMMGATYTHYLQNLSDDDCSSLLCRIAFFGREEEYNGVMKDIGINISLKCKGLPLAAKTLGSLLRFKRNQKDWQSILESDIWELDEVDKGFLKPALLLSYYDLPSTLKNCFLYCSLFPKDHKIKKVTLIKLWMAQGFLKSTKGNKHLEMIGEDYFNKLAMLSFFQDFVKDANGNIITCKMHDLVHDFAQSLSKNQCSIIDNGSMQLLNSSSKIRHLTFVCEEDIWPANSILTSISKDMKLRTLQLFNGCQSPIEDVPSNLFQHLRCLRVLRLSSIGLENLSSEISQLIHLRYLDLSKNTKLQRLPETIVCLYNLETLKLKCCRSLYQLPREIGRMMNLKHLDITRTGGLIHLPQGIGRLSSLQTLTKFIVGGASEGCKIGELKYLNLLQGDLTITGIGRVDTVNEAFEVVLWTKKHLHTLDLDFGVETWQQTEIGNEENQEKLLLIERMEGVLEGLQPHSNLVNLNVYHFLGFSFPSWINCDSVLFNLQTLELYSCSNCNHLPALGQLPSLEVLKIEDMWELKSIGFEFYTHGVEHVNRIPFPKLRELQLKMHNLEVWELGHGEVMPCLRYVEISCPNLKALPALGKLPSLEDLKIIGAKQLTYIGHEFLYEIDEVGGGCFNDIAFPKLKHFLMFVEELEWEFGVVEGTGEMVIMPCLLELVIKGSVNLKTLGVLSKLSSLETLSILSEADGFIKYIGHDYDDDAFSHAREVLFPNLKKLALANMDTLEELRLGVQVMPRLSDLVINYCPKLKAIPHSLPNLESLALWGCPLLLHEFTFFFPNLKSLQIAFSPHSLLPQGLERITSLQCLSIYRCHSLTFMPEGVMQNLTSLQELKIEDSPILEQRCRKDEGEDWGIISHIPNITIGYQRFQS